MPRTKKKVKSIVKTKVISAHELQKQYMNFYTGRQKMPG